MEPPASTTDETTPDDGGTDLPTAIAAVYGGPLEDFVPRRDALAKDLRTAGRRDDAAAVKRLRKPTRSAWALDAGVADAPEVARQAAVAVTTTVEAQASGGDLRSAFDRMRTALRALAAAAARAATDRGHPVDAGDLVPALLAVIEDADAFEALRAGRLAAIPAGGGLGLLAGAPPGTPTATADPSPEPASGREHRGGTPEPAGPDEQAAVTAAARDTLRSAEVAAASAGRRLDAAERDGRRARAELEVAEDGLRRAEREARSRRAALEAARQAEETARAGVDEAEAAVAAARAELDRLTG